MSADVIQRGFAGHFIGATRCCFRLCHDVGGPGGVRVSTVGCYHPRGDGGYVPPQDIGVNRKFETFVFRLLDNGRVTGLGLPDADMSEIDSEGYNDWESAEAGHAAMVAKWSTIEGDKA